jgi:hypothetical protein
MNFTPLSCGHCGASFDDDDEENNEKVKKYYQEETSSKCFCHGLCQHFYYEDLKNCEESQIFSLMTSNFSSNEILTLNRGGGRGFRGRGNSSGRNNITKVKGNLGGRGIHMNRGHSKVQTRNSGNRTYKYAPSNRQMRGVGSPIAGRGSKGYGIHHKGIGGRGLNYGYWGGRFGHFRYGYGLRWFGYYSLLLPYFNWWLYGWYPRYWTPIYIPQSENSTTMVVNNNNTYIMKDIATVKSLPILPEFSPQLKARLTSLEYKKGESVNANTVHQVADEVNMDLEKIRQDPQFTNYETLGYVIVPDLDTQSFTWVKEGKSSQ